MRGGDFFNSISSSLEILEQNNLTHEVIFLEAAEEVLVRRFKESRRPHPLSSEGGILDGIRAEKAKLEEIRGKANLIVDTSNLTVRQLREVIVEKYSQVVEEQRMIFTIVSFGFRNGIPLDADLVFDVRFLPNPFYVDSLKGLTGNNKEVEDYVLKWPVTSKFLRKLYGLMEFLAPQYINEGKTQLIIGIGCTGGRHRSVQSPIN